MEIMGSILTASLSLFLCGLCLTEMKNPFYRRNAKLAMELGGLKLAFITQNNGIYI